MAKVNKPTHPESDVVVSGHPAAYRPVQIDGVCYKADDNWVTGSRSLTSR